MNSVEQHFQTRLNRLVKQRFDFAGIMPREDFVFRIQYLESELPDIPRPPIQVAQESDFHWNNETAQAVLDGLWFKMKDKLAKEHLSRESYSIFREGTESDLAGLSHRYQEAYRNRKGQSGAVGLDSVLRSMRAKASAPIPMTKGLCSTCAERSQCRAQRPDKVKCNDYAQHSKAPRNAGNAPSRRLKGSGYENIAGQILKGGI